MVEYTLTINKKSHEVSITHDSFEFKCSNRKKIIKTEDILGFDQEPTADTKSISMYYIRHGDKKLEKKVLTIEGQNDSIQDLVSVTRENISRVSSRPTSIVIFLNPMGGAATSQSVFHRDVEPILKQASIKYHLIVSEGPNHPTEFAQSFDFSPFNMLVIMSGDGTYNRILNSLIPRQQPQGDINDPNVPLNPLDIPIAFIPAGTGNGIAKMAYDSYDVTSAVLHIIRGKTTLTPILGIYSGDKLAAYSFMMSATGMFVELIRSTDKRRWMRRARYLYVMLYYFFIRNHRRFNVEMEMEDILKPDSNETSLKETMTEEIIGSFLCLFGVSGRPKHMNNESLSEYILAGVFKPSSRLQFLKNFANLFRESIPTEEDSRSSLIMKYVKAVRIRVVTPDPSIDYNINVDGEVYDTAKPEVYVKIIPNAYKMITAQYVHEQGT